MLTLTDQTHDLYAAMHIPLVPVEDAALLMREEANRSPIAARDFDTPQQEKLRQLTEAGLAYYNNGKLEEAAKSYEEALELCPDSMLALYSLE